VDLLHCTPIKEWELQPPHPAIRQYTFFSAVHGTFSKIDHIVGHKASPKKFKKIKITPCIISDHNRIKLDLNKKETPENIQTHRD
jgi:hypothetical protein